MSILSHTFTFLLISLIQLQCCWIGCMCNNDIICCHAVPLCCLHFYIYDCGNWYFENNCYLFINIQTTASSKFETMSKKCQTELVHSRINVKTKSLGTHCMSVASGGKCHSTAFQIQNTDRNFYTARSGNMWRHIADTHTRLDDTSSPCLRHPYHTKHCTTIKHR